MGGYRSEDEALIGLARQLADAYGEARTRDDQDFACDAIDEFLAEYRMEAPSEALLAILDLPLTSETFPLVDEAQTTLADRGSGVVGLLLEAVLGEVYDPDGPAPERAAETLDMMDRRASVQGLVEVLCGRAEDDVKSAAVDGLVALGPVRGACPCRRAERPERRRVGGGGAASRSASSAATPEPSWSTPPARAPFPTTRATCSSRTTPRTTQLAEDRAESQTDAAGASDDRRTGPAERRRRLRRVPPQIPAGDRSRLRLVLISLNALLNTAFTFSLGDCAQAKERL